MKHLGLIFLFLLFAVAGYYSYEYHNQPKHFAEFEYNPEDWVSTEHTYLATNVSNIQMRPSEWPIWTKIDAGIQLKPLVWIEKKVVIVELPSGQRGAVLPATLSGLRPYDVIDPRVSGSAKFDVSGIGYIDKFALPDSANVAALITFLDFEDYFVRHYHKGVTRNKRPFPNGSDKFNVKMIYAKGDDFYACDPSNLVPEFAKALPTYNRNYRLYAEDEQIKDMTKEQIVAKYGDNISSELTDKGERLFFRHLMNKKNWYKNGSYVMCTSEGNYFEPYEDSKKDGRLVYGNPGSIISKVFPSFNWSILPGVYPIVRRTKINLEPISLFEKPIYLTGIIQLFYVLVLYVVLYYLLSFLIFQALSGYKKLSESAIYTIGAVLILPFMIFVAAHCIEFSRDCWFITCIISAVAIIMPLTRLDGILEFGRCDFCRNTGCTKYKRVLTDTKVSSRKKYIFSEDKELGKAHDHGDQHVNAVDAGDFDRFAERTTSKYVTEVVLEKTIKYYDYNFVCKSCHKTWTNKHEEENEEEISRKKRLVSRVKESLKFD
ncbi:MAG: hypothetical protein R3Y38_04155 [Rikenellaceae bacterium]